MQFDMKLIEPIEINNICTLYQPFSLPNSLKCMFLVLYHIKIWHSNFLHLPCCKWLLTFLHRD